MANPNGQLRLWRGVRNDRLQPIDRIRPFLQEVALPNLQRHQG
ncbi:MAG: hypothetical protein ACKO24_00795 [Leptolyngbyaceae cyanobacterium]